MTNSKFTKKELSSLNVRWIWHSQIGWNYERMQGLGYLTTMLPVIEKLYANDPAAKDKALRVHSQFFNTQPAMGDIIVGMNIALEEQGGASAIDTAAVIKTGLMGPFAGIGDTIFGMIGGTVFGSIAVSFAVEKNPIGIILWTIWNLFVLFWLRPQMFQMGYKQGVTLVTTMSDKLQAFTEAASVLGVTVIGAMIATMVNVRFGVVTVFGNGIDLQEGLMDKLMPKLGPAIIVALCYWLLGKKWMNSNKLIWAVLIACVSIAFLGHLVPEVQILVNP